MKARDLEDIDDLEKITETAFKDPITKILLKYSNLTVTQFETLIIDLISEILSDKKLTYDEKRFLRSRMVSRGSFSRTLSQARRNVVTSIYTILLLNYVGLFSGAPFEEYQILADKLRNYVDLVKNSDPASAKNVLMNIERELIEGIIKMADPKSIRPV